MDSKAKNLGLRARCRFTTRAFVVFLIFFFVVLQLSAASLTFDTEVRVTGIMGFRDQVFVSLEVSNVQARIHEIPPVLRIGERHGDLEIKSVDASKGLVMLETASGTIQLSVGRTAHIRHVPFGRAAHRDELYARYGDFVPPGRFRSSE